MGTLVTAQELAEYLKVSDSTIYKLACAGEIPGFKVGDSWRFDMDEILEMIERSKNRVQKRHRRPNDCHEPEMPANGSGRQNASAKTILKKAGEAKWTT